MISKRAYPNDEGYTYMPTVYNLERWTNALRDIYVKVRLGVKKEAAKTEILSSWPENERYNFANWMKYYESGEISKYKTASTPFYINEEANYFLPNPPGRFTPPSPLRDLNQIAQEANNIADRVAPGMSKEDERKANEAFRHKLISRLNSLEKHLGTSQGYLFAGDEFENLLSSIHSLKAKIMSHNKLKLSAQTCLDLLIKEANILNRKNFKTASEVMVKVAQEMPAGGLDLNAPPPAPMPPPGAPLPAAPDGGANETKTGLEGFLDNLQGGGITDGTDGDELDADDEVEFGDEVEMKPKKAAYWDMVVEAQEAKQIKPPKDKKAAPLEEEAPKAKSNFDALVDSAFNTLKVEDLLSKLQDINIIFTNKEISKQLALADLMFSKLGLTPYFSNFSEVQQKNLDCINYSASRMQDIIATLQGGLGRGKIDISKEPDPNNPETELLQRHLENEEKKEDDRKAVRKEVSQQDMMNKNKPEIEVEDAAKELAAPEEQIAPPVKAPVAPRGV